MEFDFKSLNDKIVNSASSPSLSQEEKREKQNLRCSKFQFERNLERERGNFSLEIHAIQPLAVFGTRRRTALRGEGFVWVPDLGSFFKLLEVGVSPYLSFIPSLSVFQCFGWYEALNGRLIGPKPWDRIDRNFWKLKT